jgi:hypothetical protein
MMMMMMIIIIIQFLCIHKELTKRESLFQTSNDNKHKAKMIILSD